LAVEFAAISGEACEKVHPVEVEEVVVDEVTLVVFVNAELEDTVVEDDDELVTVVCEEVVDELVPLEVRAKPRPPAITMTTMTATAATALLIPKRLLLCIGRHKKSLLI
jgi:hypothetical protein